MKYTRHCSSPRCEMTREEHQLVEWVAELKATKPDPDLFRQPPQDGGKPSEGR
ncbi:hypothetical protein M2302_002242 [Micromonospora sp. A200]|nr:hypothetical protein [Micromonospora sp. A200]